MCGVSVVSGCFMEGLLDASGVVIFLTAMKFLSRSKHFAFKSYLLILSGFVYFLKLNLDHF